MAEPDQALGVRDLLGLGGILAGSVVGFTLIGLLVDHIAGWSPWGVVTGVAVGIAAGIAGFMARVLGSLRATAMTPPPPREHDDGRYEGDDVNDDAEPGSW